MKKRKLLAMALSCIMAFSVVACGNSGNSQDAAPADAEPAAETTAPAEEPAAEDAATETPAAESTDITLWTYPIGGWGDSAVVDGLIANFNAAHPEINVTVEYLDYTNGDDQVNTAI
ncbi:MAG: carbohydrate ABC transporter substrate-binding protein, partial [Kineothrix sp.]|nr:carbohydrate ABC transporter substrate-binding protein [Kineothrix sp.]